MKRDTLHILTGPTAVGKTARALAWAEANDAEIVSCDSLLFYCGMDIGTAKPTREERARVPHHLIDCVPVTQQLDVGRYVTLAREAIEGIQARGRRVLVVGGSGFYLKAFFGPVVDDCDIPRHIREQVSLWERESGLPGLLRELHRVSPEGLGRLDINNPRRVARALERCLASGCSLPEQEVAFAQKPGSFDAWPKDTTLLMRVRDDLEARIEARTQAMLEAGLIEEVKALQAAGFEKNPSASGAIGYRETLAWLKAGDGDQHRLAEAISQSTRRLVAKQLKWFRGQLKPDRVEQL